jgi:hypothetical protein
MLNVRGGRVRAPDPPTDRRLPSRIGRVILRGIALVVGAVAALYVVVVLYFAGLRFVGPIQEVVRGEYPSARIEAYLAAVRKGALADATAAWHAPEGPSPSRLRERRAAVTAELIGARLRSGHEVLNTEWWGTCCEPHLVTSQRDAGLARVRVRLQREDGTPLDYTFDVKTPGAYWGAAMDYPAREWRLVDVYPDGDEPMAFKWVRGPPVRRLQG